MNWEISILSSHIDGNRLPFITNQAENIHLTGFTRAFQAFLVLLPTGVTMCVVLQVFLYFKSRENINFFKLQCWHQQIQFFLLYRIVTDCCYIYIVQEQTHRVGVNPALALAFKLFSENSEMVNFCIILIMKSTTNFFLNLSKFIEENCIT